MTQLPKMVRLMRYHWRHYSILDLSKKGLPHLYEAAQQFGADHAAAISGIALVSPEDQCKTWLKSHGYANTVGDLWELTNPETV